LKPLTLNFSVPEDIARKLKIRVGKRKRSAFVAEAVRIRLEEPKREQLREVLVEGYHTRCQKMPGLIASGSLPLVDQALKVHLNIN
jgi:hypothetical protein